MRCNDVRATLVQRDHAKMSAELRDHVAECADCGAYDLQAQKLNRLLDLDEDVEPRPGFDTRFFARLEELKTQRANKETASWWRRWPVWVAAASLSVSAAAAVMLLGVPAPTTLSLENDLALAMDLEMLEELDLVRQLDAVEAYEVLALLELDDLDAVSNAGVPQ